MAPSVSVLTGFDCNEKKKPLYLSLNDKCCTVKNIVYSDLLFDGQTHPASLQFLLLYNPSEATDIV